MSIQDIKIDDFCEAVVPMDPTRYRNGRTIIRGKVVDLFELESLVTIRSPRGSWTLPLEFIVTRRPAALEATV